MGIELGTEEPQSARMESMTRDGQSRHRPSRRCQRLVSYARTRRCRIHRADGSPQRCCRVPSTPCWRASRVIAAMLRSWWDSWGSRRPIIRVGVPASGVLVPARLRSSIVPDPEALEAPDDLPRRTVGLGKAQHMIVGRSQRNRVCAIAFTPRRSQQSSSCNPPATSPAGAIGLMLASRRSRAVRSASRAAYRQRIRTELDALVDRQGQRPITRWQFDTPDG
jgi:hypothetical protein